MQRPCSVASQLIPAEAAGNHRNHPLQEPTVLVSLHCTRCKTKVIYTSPTSCNHLAPVGQQLDQLGNMRFWVVLLLFGLVLTHSMHRARAEDDDDSAAVEDDDEDYDGDSDRAHLVVRKSLSTDLGVQGRNITFTIELYNAGKSSAKEVKLVDAALPEGMSLLEGSLEGTYSTIEPGSSVKHVYVATAVKGEKGHVLEAATVSYKADADGHQQVTHSSRPAVYIMTPFEQVQRYGLIAGRYATLGMARTPADWRNLTIFIVLVAGALGANSMYKSANTARTDRRRKQALASLEKDQ